jgi:hypothetical protein
MFPEKNMLSLEEIDAQSALELPQRELLTLVVSPRIDINVPTITQIAIVTQVNINLFSVGHVLQTNENGSIQFAQA